tara:strand:- start:3099 stop:3575 length:477 start_codon:yes stop_codon:yes gene_type:complete
MIKALNYKTMYERPYLAAIIGGVLVSFLPTLFVNLVSSYFPSTSPEELQTVSNFFSSGFGLLQFIFFAIIVFIVPVVEEFIFRGALWKLFVWINRSPKWTWIAISILFAAIHMEPLHVIGLLPFSFFVGWLRLKTNSLGPSIIAHMSHNAAGCLIMML